MCGDFNAKSTLWHNEETDYKGQAVEELIMARNLEVVNNESDLTTYESTRGAKSNIDITMITRQYTWRITNWGILDELLNSDHRLIEFELHVGPRARPSANREHIGEIRPGLRDVTWCLFDRTIAVDLSLIVNHDELDLDTKVQRLTEATSRAWREATATSKGTRLKPQWWTAEITNLRRAKISL